MPVGTIAAFWGVSFLFVITPGADWAYAMAAGLRNRTVLPAVGGLLIGHLIATAAVAAGVAVLVARSPLVLTTLTVAGAAYLIWLGLGTLRHPGLPEVAAELAELVLGAIPKKFHVKNIHPATRVFQALRIAANDELSAIGESIGQAHRLLAPGGRIMAISFHSLEDRIVKDKFRRMARGCSCAEEPRHCRCVGMADVKLLTKKPLRPEVDEIEGNSRARSARLRVCEKIAEERPSSTLS